MSSISSIRFLLSLVTTILMFSCAESPKSSSKKKQSPITQSTERIESKVTRMAVKYQGQDSLSRKCDLYISLEEEKNKKTAKHEHHLLIKVDYATLDGHKPNDEVSEFYLFDATTGKYLESESNQSNTNLAILGFSMKDQKQNGDKNNIETYMKNNQLEQSISIQFSSSANQKDFEKSLESLIEDEATIDQHMQTLDNIENINMALSHNDDHYHTPTCLNLEPVSMQKTSFILSKHSHKNHDHEIEANTDENIIIDGNENTISLKENMNTTLKAMNAVLSGDNKIKAVALEYVGNDNMRQKCKLYIALQEHEHLGVREKVEALMQVDYKTMDGHKPNDGEAQFYLYDGRADRYYDLDSDNEKARLALLSFSLKNKKLKADKNKIKDYIKNTQLQQLARVQFAKDVKFDDYEIALHQVLKKEKSIDQNFEQLNVVKALPLVLLHGDHYHTPLCMNLKPTKIMERLFDLDPDHDHEHGHH